MNGRKRHQIGESLQPEVGQYRRRDIRQGPVIPSTTISGKPCLNFSSNDYLGLANHSAVKSAMIDAIARLGVGSGGSPLMSGYASEHQKLERDLAEHLGCEQALLFTSGYAANLGVVTALAAHKDTIFFDAENHASLIDAALLSGATLRRYPHGNIAALKLMLRQPSEGAKIVLSDAVFSMSGDRAALCELAEVCRFAGARLVVDDAHGLGVLGPQGSGAVAESGVDSADVHIVVGTLGKALGTSGAFAAGSRATIETLSRKARPYVYSTAMPVAVAAASREALKVCRRDQWRRDKLARLIGHFRNGMASSGLQLSSFTLPIQPIFLGTEQKALDLSSELWEQGIHARAILAPTVARGAARIRISLTALHTTGHVNYLVNALTSAQTKRT